VSNGAYAPRLERELFVRHARKAGRSVAILRAHDRGDRCTVDTEAFAAAGEEPTKAQYTFEDAREATAFVTEAVEALMYLGCDVQAE